VKKQHWGLWPRIVEHRDIVTLRRGTAGSAERSAFTCLRVMTKSLGGAGEKFLRSLDLFERKSRGAGVLIQSFRMETA
jgi:hypothetical protein